MHRKAVTKMTVLALLSLSLVSVKASAQTPTAEKPSAPTVAQLYQELLELSQKERRGLVFFVRGQTIPGIVTKIFGQEAVQVRNQTYGRLIIRLDQVDALGAN
jgi:hypothetical protein